MCAPSHHRPDEIDLILKVLRSVDTHTDLMLVATSTTQLAELPPALVNYFNVVHHVPPPAKSLIQAFLQQLLPQLKHVLCDKEARTVQVMQAPPVLLPSTPSATADKRLRQLRLFIRGLLDGIKSSRKYRPFFKPFVSVNAT